MGQFAKLLEGYASEPPIAFILCGDFLSPAPSGKRKTDALRGSPYPPIASGSRTWVCLLQRALLTWRS